MQDFPVVTKGREWRFQPDAVPFLRRHLQSCQRPRNNFPLVTFTRSLPTSGQAGPPGRRNGLCFSGDLGQRIFQQPFSWKSLGVDVRGRSHTLRVNYRTSHQIRERADRLLPGAISDVDGLEESRKRTVSLFNGQPPEIRTFANADEEARAVGGWLMDLMEDGVAPEEIGLFVRLLYVACTRARDHLLVTGIEPVSAFLDDLKG